MIVWLEKALVLAIHDRLVAEHGGSAGVRDDGLLESALARPQRLHACGNPPPDLADLRRRWRTGSRAIIRSSTATSAPPRSAAKPSSS